VSWSGELLVLVMGCYIIGGPTAEAAVNGPRGQEANQDGGGGGGNVRLTDDDDESEMALMIRKTSSKKAEGWVVDVEVSSVLNGVFLLCFPSILDWELGIRNGLNLVVYPLSQASLHGERPGPLIKSWFLVW